MVFSAFGIAKASGPGPPTYPPGITGSSTPYYPYLVSPSLFPSPQSAISATSNQTVSLPELGSTGIGTNPLYFLVYASTVVSSRPLSYTTTFEVSEGIFAASIAQNILQDVPGPPGQPSPTLPLSWSTPYNIGGFSAKSNCSSSALVVAADGSSVVAGITCGSTSYLYLSSVASALSSWTNLGTVAGIDIRLALDPYGFVAATTIESGGTLLITTFPIPGGTIVSSTLGAAVDANPVILRTQAGAEEGVVASTPSNTVVFYSSWNDGRSFSSTKIGPLNDTNVSAALATIGSTFLNTPGGFLGQVSATVVGGNLFVLSTVLQLGQMIGAVYVSSDDGLVWEGPSLFPLTAGAMIDPEVLGTQVGYVYASWLATAGTNLTTIENAVFSPDGRIVQDPAPIPGGTGAWKVGNRPVVGMAVDSFQRLLLTWATPASPGGNALSETGAFLSVANAVAAMQQGVLNVSSPNLVGSTSVSTFTTGVAGMLSEVAANASRAMNLPYLDATRNVTAGLYQNVSISPLAYIGEQVVGQSPNQRYTIAGGATLTTAVNTGPVTIGGKERPFGVLVPSEGFGSAVTYLGVVSDWLLAAEGVEAIAAANPLVNATLLNSLPSLSLFPAPVYTSTPLDGNISDGWSNTTMLSPTIAELSLWGVYAWYIPPPTFGTQEITCNGEVVYEPRTNYYDMPTSYNNTVTIDNQSTVTLKSSSWIPNIYLQNLSADSRVSWTAVQTATYTMEFDTVNYHGFGGGCDPLVSQMQKTSPMSGYPTSISMSGGSTFVTTLVTQLSATQSGNKSLSIAWRNSMLAEGTETLNPSGPVTAITKPATGYVLSTGINYTSNSLIGINFTAEVSTTSYPGGWNSTLKPTLSANQQTSSEAQQYQAACTFETIANDIEINNIVTTSGKNDTGTVTWTSNTEGLGILEYYEIGTTLNFSVVAARTFSSGIYIFTAGLNGLFGAAFYELNATVTESIGSCFSVSNGKTTLAELGQGFTLQSIAYPYDSITQTGGGEGIFAPMAISLYDQLHLYTGGSLTYGLSSGSSSSIVIPIPSLIAIQYGWGGFLENLTGMTGNASYTVQEIWNFTWDGQSLSLSSAPMSFIYLQDSSGDGLTDVEKLNGWPVTFTNVSGGVVQQRATANPSLYSTNGLVGDYIEKEFGLNPTTVDTAGSHMLDTWNLTFNLGLATSAKLPKSGFAYWYENSSYNPFASGAPSSANQNRTNLTPTSAGGITSGDGSPWAATVLWSTSALSTFLNLTA